MEIRGFHPTCFTISVRQEEAHAAVDNSDNRPLCSLKEMMAVIGLQGNSPTAGIPAEASQTGSSDGEIVAGLKSVDFISG